MKFNDPLPQLAEAALRATFHDGESVRFSLTSDLSPDRQFGETMLVATDKQIAVLDRTGVLWRAPLSDISEIKIDELFGSGRLLAVTEDGVEILSLLETEADSSYVKESRYA